MVVFLVKIISYPSKKLGDFIKEGHKPTADAHDNARDSTKKSVVELLVTKVYISGQRQKGEAQEGAGTGCCAHSSNKFTHPNIVGKKIFSFDNTFK